MNTNNLDLKKARARTSKEQFEFRQYDMLLCWLEKHFNNNQVLEFDTPIDLNVHDLLELLKDIIDVLNDPNKAFELLPLSFELNKDELITEYLLPLFKLHETVTGFIENCIRTNSTMCFQLSSKEVKGFA